MVLLFWLSVFFIFYTYAGYPLLLWLKGKTMPKPIQKGSVQPSVVIVIVAHNESSRIEAKIESCLKQNYPQDKLSILVVSDGSTDQTNELVSRFAIPQVRLLAHESRRGKASCLNDGVAHSTQPVIVFTDARQRLHPDAVKRLVSHLTDANVGAVSGELVFEDENGTPFSEGLGAYWAYEKFIRNQEALSGSVIGVTGALYAMRRSCFKPIPPETILDDVAIPMLAAMDGWRITFEKGAIAYDAPSTDAAREKIRKVRTIAGNFQLTKLFRQTLSPIHNPLWLRFVSHKIMRLLGPFALASALLANTQLARENSGFYFWLWTAHMGTYVLLFLAIRFPHLQKLRTIRLGVTFLYLNFFALLGLWSFLFQSQSHLWQKSGTDSTPNTRLKSRNNS